MATYNLPIYVPADLMQALGEHTGHFWSDPAMEPIIYDAIRAWMKPAPAAPAAQQQPATLPEAGYQWKQVFLPEGTKLRACFDRQPYFAVVEGAQIKYGEHAVSPSCFANLHGSGNRNAWKAVWLRFPGSEEWLLADVCRSARKAAIARLFGEDLHQARPSSRTAPSRAAPRQRQDHDRRQDHDKRPSRRAGAGGSGAGERTAAAPQPAAKPSWPPQNEIRPPSAPGAANSNGKRSKNGSGRKGRRKHKRHVTQHPPGNP